MKRILIIGARGMLGRDLVEVLRSSRGNLLPEESEIIGWDLEEIDIRQEAPTISQIRSLGPDIVIHLASYTDVDGCEKNREEAFQVNAEGTRHVAAGAREVGARVVYLSTDYVFDGKKTEPYLETDLPHPLSVYGQSKLKGEEYLQEQVRNFLIIRTQWLYGRHGRNFVSAILRQAREKPVLSIVDDQTGSPTYTVDLARAIASLLRRGSQGIFHVANQGACTWHTFGQTILKFSGTDGISVKPISSKALGRPAIRPSYSVLDTQKVRREAGMSLRPWPEALKEFLDRLAVE
jgi:dTDP-4-dehydrorhamnose reductase